MPNRDSRRPDRSGDRTYRTGTRSFASRNKVLWTRRPPGSQLWRRVAPPSRDGRPRLRRSCLRIVGTEHAIH